MWLCVVMICCVRVERNYRNEMKNVVKIRKKCIKIEKSDSNIIIGLRRWGDDRHSDDKWKKCLRV